MGSVAAMKASTLTLDRGGERIFVYAWLPDGDAPVRGVVQVSHGMAEHAARYEPLAESLVAQGFAVYAHDHRGHGRTAGDPSRRGHFADRDGWRAVVDDLYAVGDHARAQHPGAPHVLFAHSMGAFMGQQALYERGGDYAAVVLSGSTSPVSNPLAPIGRVVARAERWRLGPKSASALLTKLSFGEFNRAFKPARTEYDWLSRDAAQVDRYIADPWCGFDMTTQSWVDLLDALPVIAAPENVARIPKDVPVYILAGSMDPVSGAVKGLRQLVDAWSAAGLRDLTWKVYEQGRHEMLNEINRAEVLDDLRRWLERTVPAKKGDPS